MHEKYKEPLRYRHVNPVEKLIRVPAEVAKTGKARLIQGLPTTVWAWLGPPARSSPDRGAQAICPVYAIQLHRRAAACSAAGVEVVPCAVVPVTHDTPEALKALLRDNLGQRPRARHGRQPLPRRARSRRRARARARARHRRHGAPRRHRRRRRLVGQAQRRGGQRARRRRRRRRQCREAPLGGRRRAAQRRH